jgi:hypothetical protein
MGNPWAKVGAVAIAWELEKLGIPPPAVWTIDRILRRAGVPKRRARNRYVPREPPTQSAPCSPDQTQSIGSTWWDPPPRGRVPFYALNGLDVGRRRAGIEILASKEEHEVSRGLAHLWSRLGVPKVAQFDNEQTISPAGDAISPARTDLPGTRGPGPADPVRGALAQRRRGALQRHLRQAIPHRAFRTLPRLVERAAAIEAFHNTHHRYSALRGRPPCVACTPGTMWCYV